MWPFKKKPRWKLVKTIEAKVTWAELTGAEDTIYYYLFESNSNNRRVQAKTTNRNGMLYGNTSIPWQHPMYLASIVPWLKGENYSDIPTYWEKAEEENEYYIGELYKRILSNGLG